GGVAGRRGVTGRIAIPADGALSGLDGQPAAQKGADLHGSAAATGGAGPLSAGIDVVRGPALDRPQLARTARPDDRACGAAAIAAGADLSAGIPGPLDRAVTRDFADPEPARPAERRGDGLRRPECRTNQRNNGAPPPRRRL